MKRHYVQYFHLINHEKFMYTVHEIINTLAYIIKLIAFSTPQKLYSNFIGFRFLFIAFLRGSSFLVSIDEKCKSGFIPIVKQML